MPQHQGCPLDQVLYGLIALAASGFISFRLLVQGKNVVNPDWLNIPLIFAAFLIGMYGFVMVFNCIGEFIG